MTNSHHAPNTPLIGDEDFPTVKMDKDIYKKLENSPHIGENSTSLYPPNRSFSKYVILILSVVGMAAISMSMYVVHKYIPHTPSISQLHFVPSLHSPFGGQANYFETILNPAVIKSREKDHHRHTFSFLSKRAKEPRKWTTKEWENTFNAYTKHFSIDLSDHMRQIRGSDPRNHILTVFRANVLKIERHNAVAAKDASPQFLRINQFSHFTFEEFRTKYLMTKSEMNPEHVGKTQSFNGDILQHVSNGTLPDYINWFERGCVTPVKDQAKCGSCWAFSSTGAIEGATCANGGPLVSLSEQELVDCARDEGAQGCNGGYMDDAFHYVMHHSGLCSEEEYPYIGKVSQCRSCKKVANIKGILSIPKDNEKAVRAALVSYGPVAAGIEADRHEFQFYHSGVFSLPCGKKLNHAILIVGYGVDEVSGVPYWLVKNSWGSQWGDHGYIKLARKGHGKAGECGILLSPTAPIIGA